MYMFALDVGFCSFTVMPPLPIVHNEKIIRYIGSRTYVLHEKIFDTVGCAHKNNLNRKKITNTQKQPQTKTQTQIISPAGTILFFCVNIVVLDDEQLKAPKLAS